MRGISKNDLLVLMSLILKKHQAGNDLTDFLKTAPNGEEKTLQMPEGAELVPLEINIGKPILTSSSFPSIMNYNIAS